MLGTKRVRAHFGQSNFPFSQQKRKKEILLILIIFTYFKVQKKIEKKKMVREIDHFFIFLILKSASKIFNGEEKKNLIRTHFPPTNLVRRFTQGRLRCGGIFFFGRGGGL